MVVGMKRKLQSTLLAVAVGTGMTLAAGTASAEAIVAPTNTWFEFSLGERGRHL